MICTSGAALTAAGDWGGGRVFFFLEHRAEPFVIQPPLARLLTAVMLELQMGRRTRPTLHQGLALALVWVEAVQAFLLPSSVGLSRPEAATASRVSTMQRWVHVLHTRAARSSPDVAQDTRWIDHRLCTDPRVVYGHSFLLSITVSVFTSH